MLERELRLTLRRQQMQGLAMGVDKEDVNAQLSTGEDMFDDTIRGKEGVSWHNTNKLQQNIHHTTTLTDPTETLNNFTVIPVKTDQVGVLWEPQERSRGINGGSVGAGVRRLKTRERRREPEKMIGEKKWREIWWLWGWQFGEKKDEERSVVFLVGFAGRREVGGGFGWGRGWCGIWLLFSRWLVIGQSRGGESMPNTTNDGNITITQDRIIVFTDAGLQMDKEKTSIGMVAKDSCGHLLYALGAPIQFVGKTITAEALTIR
ncbi:hypothetical protein HAX54_000512 [Datura stramonium]|uniref:Uncharacterized protein n=1 Tax=Datura stramonium TaxID=4076 RepID=A0ABS8WU18_DATST|nr:hypothetical protein [Datura stramonium]